MFNIILAIVIIYIIICIIRAIISAVFETVIAALQAIVVGLFNVVKGIIFFIPNVIEKVEKKICIGLLRSKRKTWETNSFRWQVVKKKEVYLILYTMYLWDSFLICCQCLLVTSQVFAVVFSPFVIDCY